MPSVHCSVQIHMTRSHMILCTLTIVESGESTCGLSSRPFLQPLGSKVWSQRSNYLFSFLGGDLHWVLAWKIQVKRPTVSCFMIHRDQLAHNPELLAFVESNTHSTGLVPNDMSLFVFVFTGFLFAKEVGELLNWIPRHIRSCEIQSSTSPPD
jgi:hypothetical protein